MLLMFLLLLATLISSRLIAMHIMQRTKACAGQTGHWRCSNYATHALTTQRQDHQFWLKIAIFAISRMLNTYVNCYALFP